MRSQKRSHTVRAYSRGYQAGITGKSRSQCPHETSEARQQWLSGWREGREDHWDGFNTMAQLQKMHSVSRAAV